MSSDASIGRWGKILLRDVGEFINGFAFKPTDWGANGLPIIRIQNLNDSTKPYNYFRGRLDERFLVQPGDILISWSASLGVFRWENGDAWLNQHIFKAVPKSAAVNADYFYWAAMREIVSIAQLAQGSTMKHVTRKVFLDSEIPLPPLEEQRAIACALETVQKVKEAMQCELALERERKAALMEYLFAHGTRDEPTKQTEIGEIPENWKVEPLSSVAGLVSGGTPSRENASWWKGAIPWASPKDMKSVRLADTQEHVSEEGIENGSRLVPSGTIFIVIRGMILAKDTPIALAEVPMAFNQDMKAVLSHEGHSSEFLLYALIWRKNGLAKHIGTSAHGTRRISTAAVDSLLLPIPPHDEQIEIAQILRLCEAKIAALEREIPLHEELFKAILEELMTGRVSALPLVEEHQPQ